MDVPEQRMGRPDLRRTARKRARLLFDVAARTLQKAGTEARRYEDAFAFDAVTGRLAVADGASDAFEAGIWAQLLVASFVHAPPPLEEAAFLQWIKAPARAWNATLRWETLPWYAEQKARDVGGLATLLGLVVDPPGMNPGTEIDEMTWHALGVGDSCLLHVRDGVVQCRFPLVDCASFSTTPALLSSRLLSDDELLEPGSVRRTSGRCRPGDVFLLATDAMAKWLYAVADLHRQHVEYPGWDQVLDVLETGFEPLIEELRVQGVIRNDDMTLLIVRIDGAASEA